MQILKLAGLSIAAAAVTAIALTPASARPYHPHKVCKIERHHGRHVRICHIVR